MTDRARHPVRTLAAGGAGALLLAGGALAYSLRRVNRIRRFATEDLVRLRAEAECSLFAAYPALADRIPWCPLGAFPTPVEEMSLPHSSPGVRLLVKRDDLASDLYGGNKIRKLEHHLAEAQLDGRRTLISLGGIGSNHALAVASHGAALGFDVDLVLYDQPVTPAVRRNLGGFLAVGARLHYSGSIPRAFLDAARLFSTHARRDAAPYFIMVGGSSRLGCVGFVSAAFELANQVARGDLPEPDRIFVPLGTCGTAAGLVVGLRLAGLRSRVAAVRVADPFPANAAIVQLMAQDLADFLAAADPSIPRLSISTGDFDIITDYLGTGYGVPTAPAERAIREAAPQLLLETTYTGKTLAACADLCRESAEEFTLLFWNTYNSAPIPQPASWEGIPSRLRAIIAD